MLPVGGYSYSQGLEHAVDCKWVTCAAQAGEWILGLGETSMGRLDLPVLRRMYRAVQEHDLEALRGWNEFLLANRETAELQAEDVNMGKALARLVNDLYPNLTWPDFETQPSFALSFARLCVHWCIDINSACTGFAWIWCENQAAAAVKLVPLGQTDGQRILLRFAQIVPDIVAASSRVDDDAIGNTSPGMAIASAAHARQYTRIFRS
ncbi:MAG: urease accessory protein UreF [Proteobacteria bacterium]|nr:urease accessory protein UreF [Pseudomonadota bacterium]